MIDDSTGKAFPAGAAEQTGLPLLAGEGGGISLQTVFTATADTCAGAEGCPDLSLFAAQRYGPCQSTMGELCPAGGMLDGVWVDPWFYLDETTVAPTAEQRDHHGKTSTRSSTPSPTNVKVLGRYVNNSKAALIWAQLSAHHVIFSGSTRPPAPVWRAIALAAGVHLYSSGSPAASVEVGGNALTVHINRTLDAPFRPGGAEVDGGGQDEMATEPGTNGGAADSGKQQLLCHIDLPRVYARVANGLDGGRTVCLGCDGFDDCAALNGTSVYFLYDS